MVLFHDKYGIKHVLALFTFRGSRPKEGASWFVVLPVLPCLSSCWTYELPEPLFPTKPSLEAPSLLEVFLFFLYVPLNRLLRFLRTKLSFMSLGVSILVTMEKIKKVISTNEEESKRRSPLNATQRVSIFYQYLQQTMTGMALCRHVLLAPLASNPC